jgi:CHAT domain-containing protein
MERSRARNLADLIEEERRPPQFASEAQVQAYRQDGHLVRDLDHRLRILEAERIGLDLSDTRVRTLSATIDQLRAARSSVLLRREEAQRGFHWLDPEWGTFPLMPVSEMQALARKQQVAFLSLRVTEHGTCAVLIAPPDLVDATLIESFDRATLNRVDEWQRAYLEMRATMRLTEAYTAREVEWLASLEKSLGELGQKLWCPLHEWLSTVLETGFNPETPADIILFPGPGLLTYPLHAASWRSRCASDDARITYAPSIAAFGWCCGREEIQRRDETSLLAVRNPTARASGRALPWTEYEVDRACELVPDHYVLSHALDPDRYPANRDFIRRELPRYSLTLLATHGIYHPQRHWTESGIFTADDYDADTPTMTLGDFFEMDLSRLKLFALTACETALVDTADLTGEQLGLPAAILAAGATAVIGSLWQVDDLATALLVANFMERVFPEPQRPIAPVSLITALWQAQRWLRSLPLAEALILLENIEEKLPTDDPPVPPFGLSRYSIRRARRQITTRGQRPFERAAYWAAFAAYGFAGAVLGKTQ